MNIVLETKYEANNALMDLIRARDAHEKKGFFGRLVNHDVHNATVRFETKASAYEEAVVNRAKEINVRLDGGSSLLDTLNCIGHIAAVLVIGEAMNSLGSVGIYDTGFVGEGETLRNGQVNFQAGRGKVGIDF